MSYPATELVLDGNGNVYHLGLSPNDLADTILLVGDQDRVEQITKQFDTIRHRSQHREFVVSPMIIPPMRHLIQL